MMAAALDDNPFEVFFVCTGNRARSAVAEALFRKYTSGVNVTVSSFGTLDLGPLPPLPAVVAAARRLGLDLDGHTSRALRAESLSGGDLVVGFEPAHVSAAVVEGGADVGRTFLLGELAETLEDHIAEDDPVVRARWAVAIADTRRIRTRPDPSYSIGDPLGKPDEVVARTVDDIDRLVRRLALGLFGNAAAGADAASP